MTQSDLIESLIEVWGSEQRFADAIPPAGRRGVLRWANGTMPVPPSAWANIARALRARIGELQTLHAAVLEQIEGLDPSGRRSHGEGR